MEEFYKAIKDKIKASGYPGEVNGEDISQRHLRSDGGKRKWNLPISLQQRQWRRI